MKTKTAILQSTNLIMCVTLENFTQQHLLKLVVLVINEHKNNIKYNTIYQCKP